MTSEVQRDMYKWCFIFWHLHGEGCINSVRILWACKHSLELKPSYLEKGNQTTESAAPVDGPTPHQKLHLQPRKCQDISRFPCLEGKMMHSSRQLLLEEEFSNSLAEAAVIN